MKRKPPEKNDGGGGSDLKQIEAVAPGGVGVCLEGGKQPGGYTRACAER